MIIQIRGTSGSGKTWVMREVMKRLPGMGSRQPVYIPQRRNPIYYEFNSGKFVGAVLGSYESTCGGCDNVGSARAVYDLCHKVLDEHRFTHIFCEGLLLSEDVKWTTKLQEEGIPVRIYFLTTPIDTCISQVKSRRKEAGNEKPLNEYNTRNREGVIERARTRLWEGEVNCFRVPPNQAASKIIYDVRQSLK